MSKLLEASDTHVLNRSPIGAVRTNSDIFQSIRQESFVAGAKWLLAEAEKLAYETERLKTTWNERGEIVDNELIPCEAIHMDDLKKIIEG